jgi:mannose-1-phosphate guanylyltransferase/mannose-6-phosphate isomerase
MLGPEKRQYIADSDDTIEAAWSKIEMNRHRSVIVVEGRKTVGTLSDGDIRKAVLAGRLLTTPIKDVMNINFISLKKSEIMQARQLFENKDIFLIPIVDKNYHLIDILVR